MIPFGCDTVTIYNRRETKDANGRTVVTWHRKELPGCSWTRKTKHIRDGNALVLADVTICRIPEHPDYRNPDEWDALTAVTNQFTLAPGDIIVRGPVFDLIGPLLPASALVEKHKRRGAFVVTATKNNVFPGVPLEHYMAEGA